MLSMKAIGPRQTTQSGLSCGVFVQAIEFVVWKV